ncbi:MAG: hypothetical protein K8H74_06315 [Notoacmeibacter sp.]|nr:hypothetical protein [Notoacmeibacter sp.]
MRTRAIPSVRRTARAVLRPSIAIFLFTTTCAFAETPSGMWQAVPLLPAVAETAKCAETDGVIEAIEQKAAKALAEAQTALAKMSPAAVSDEQGEAIERLMDYSLQECAINAETQVWELVEAARERVSSALDDLESRRIAALDKCGSEVSPGYDACYSRTRIEYQALARDTANHHLDAIGADFADWRDRTGSCVERRENAVRRFDEAGVAGPFATQALGVRTQTWMLAGLHARTSRELCELVHEAAHVMDIE